MINNIIRRLFIEKHIKKDGYLESELLEDIKDQKIKKKIIKNVLKYYEVVTIDNNFKGLTKIIRTKSKGICPKCESKDYLSCERTTLQYNFIHKWEECWGCDYKTSISIITWII